MLFDFFDWWRGLRGFELILWGIALFFSLLFLLQTIFSFIVGGDHGDDSGFDGDGDHGYQFFTIKNLIAFFTMFGWAGLAAYKSGMGNALVIAVALAAGIAMVVVMWLLMRQSSKLRHSGTLQMKNAVNRIGETYLRIPAKRGGIGKVQVQVQGRFIEVDAMTDDAADIMTGKPIRVVDTINNQIVLVTSELVA